MKLIFDWSSSFYENKTVWQEDEEIISMEISQKECGFAAAKILLCLKNTANLFDKKYAKIGIKSDTNIETIFSGRVVAFPIGFGNSSVELELIAEPDDYQYQLNSFLEKNTSLHKCINKHILEEQHILFDDLFFSSVDLGNPTIFLEGKSEIFYWDMRSGKLSLSDINYGVRNINISNNEILQNSIKVRLSREPYKTINLKLSASWIQHIHDIIDVYPMIAQKFNHNLINSFTNIKSGIENICKFAWKKGYSLIRCNIREINPNTYGVLSSYSVISPDFYVRGNEESASSKKINFKRFYFDGELIFNWSYRQKRIENVNLKIINTKSEHGREKNLYFRLNAIQLPKKHPLWNYFTYYGCSDKVLYNGGVFECKEAHISTKNFEEEKWNLIHKIPDSLTDDSNSSFFCYGSREKCN